MGGGGRHFPRAFMGNGSLKENQSQQTLHKPVGSWEIHKNQAPQSAKEESEIFSAGPSTLGVFALPSKLV